MKYIDSKKDNKLRLKFANDFGHAHLRKIVLHDGTFRGINSLDIKFDYPIAAIAGKNGAGKSTILALACCAYHNHKSGFKSPKRKAPYYTYSDFFVQHNEEIPPEGLDIRYFVAYNSWKITEKFPEKIGIRFQRRWKSKGGKWNDYANRVRRTVVFLGIERIVPHSERSQSRSYLRTFKNTAPKGWEDKVKDDVGYILGKTYDKFRYLEHSKYSLPMVQVGKMIYSGFNMGAGENALFEIFSTIYACGEGSLLVIDEIELGLHAEAQKKLIDRLKDVCLETHTQVICTTHSKEIFDCLPFDARFFVENVNGNTKITKSISSEFAFSKMSAVTGSELNIFVEDDVAKSILMASLPSSVRSRVSVKIIGSASALARQLAALYVRGEDKPTIAIFDGDQKEKHQDNLTHARNMAEKVGADFDSWIQSRITYLPSDNWPESWIVQKGKECIEELSKITNTEQGDLADILDSGLKAGKHSEFFEISKRLGLERQQCLQLFTISVCQKFQADFEEIILLINNRINL